MADVRSLLRQERASRQQTGRPQKQSAAPATAPTSKKRKAVDDGSEERKRTRTEVAKGVPAGFFDDGLTGEEAIDLPPNELDTAQQEEGQREAQQLGPIPSHTSNIPTQPSQPPSNEADAAELDAFIKEMEETPAPETALRPFLSGAAIEAAPMTAAEIAAQAREEQSAHRSRRDEELEAEKEDAARQLEDEFDEMEGLEERIRKLREKREALRKVHEKGIVEDIVPEPMPAANEDNESESDDEDWDDWRFHPA